MLAQQLRRSIWRTQNPHAMGSTFLPRRVMFTIGTFRDSYDAQGSDPITQHQILRRETSFDNLNSSYRQRGI